MAEFCCRTPDDRDPRDQRETTVDPEEKLAVTVAGQEYRQRHVSLAFDEGDQWDTLPLGAATPGPDSRPPHRRGRGTGTLAEIGFGVTGDIGSSPETHQLRWEDQ